MMKMVQDWLGIVFYDNTLGEYALALINLITLVVVFSLSKRLLVSRLVKLAQRTANDFDDFLVSLLAGIGAPVFLAISLYFATLPLELGDEVKKMIRNVQIIVITIQAVFILQEVVKYGLTKFYHRARPNDPASETVIKNLANIVRWAVWALGAVFVLDNLGVNISTLVAGLGIGGIAVALAAQAVLGDLFSALSIFVDKPFELGDFIIVDDLMGTVEYIGLKTTRIRSLSGEQLVFSNSDLTKSRIKNHKRMEIRRVVFKIKIAYTTSLENLKKIPHTLKTILTGMKDIRFDRAHFESFGDFSLNFEIVYFVLSADYNLYMDRQQEINFRIKENFEKEQIEFFYPGQAAYLGDPAFQAVSRSR